MIELLHSSVFSLLNANTTCLVAWPEDRNSYRQSAEPHCLLEKCLINVSYYHDDDGLDWPSWGNLYYYCSLEQLFQEPIGPDPWSQTPPRTKFLMSFWAALGGSPILSYAGAAWVLSQHGWIQAQKSDPWKGGTSLPWDPSLAFLPDPDLSPDEHWVNSHAF